MPTIVHHTRAHPDEVRNLTNQIPGSRDDLELQEDLEQEEALTCAAYGKVGKDRYKIGCAVREAIDQAACQYEEDQSLLEAEQAKLRRRRFVRS